MLQDQINKIDTHNKEHDVSKTIHIQTYVNEQSRFYLIQEYEQGTLVGLSDQETFVVMILILMQCNSVQEALSKH